MKSKKEVVLEFNTVLHTYRFSMPEDAPAGEVVDVAFQLLKVAAKLVNDSIVREEQSYKESEGV